MEQNPNCQIQIDTSTKMANCMIVHHSKFGHFKNASICTGIL